MIRTTEAESRDPVDRDERLGEAIEAYLALAEVGPPPDPEEFVAQYPDLGEELSEALEGLALVRGLVGRPNGQGARLEAGRRIAGYKIVRELGRGGMGVVYEAVHVDLDRPVALKVLGLHAAPDSASRRRFLNEAKTAAGLHHTHIVPVFDVGQVGGLCYYAMQRIEGTGLDRVLRRLRRDRTTAAGSNSGTRLRGSAPVSASLPGADDAPSTRGSRSASRVDDLSAVSASATRALGHEPTPVDESTYDPPTASAYYRWVADVGRQAAQALGYAHARGVVHRDIKPSNLLLDLRGTTWVADFGLARRLEDPDLTRSDSRLGTPRYMSPEQADGQTVDHRTDLYSLGATLYELLTLRPPFEGRTAAELARQVVGWEPVAPRHFDSRVPRDLETIVLKAMAKRPGDRYGSAQDLADDLMRFLRFEPVKARRISPLGRTWRFARRHPTSSAVTVVATAVVLAVATWSYVQIVAERNLARQAERAKELERRAAVSARGEAQQALARRFLSDAALVRLSTVTDRRPRGLLLLRDALELNHDPEFRREARDEALELLALRDVGDRRELPTGRVHGLAFAPEGDRLATLSDDGAEFRLWDTASRTLVASHSLAADEDEATPDPLAMLRQFGLLLGPRIVAAGAHVAVLMPGGRSLRYFDARTGDPGRQFSLPNGHVALALYASADGSRLVTIERDRPREREERPRERDGAESRWQVLLWDSEQLDEPVGRLEDTADAPPASPAPAAGNGPGRSGGRPGEPPPRSLEAWPPLIGFSPDGQTIAIARLGDSVVTLWSALDGQVLTRGSTPRRIDTKAGLGALALGPSGLLATGGTGGLQLWDLNTPTVPTRLTTHLNRIRLLRFDRDGTLAVAGWNAGVELWDPAASTPLAVLPTPERVDDMAFAPGSAGSNRTLAAASGSLTTAWTGADPIGVRRMTGFDRPPSSLAFGPAGRLAVSAWPRPMRLWDPSGCPLSEREWDGVVPIAVAFAARGRLATFDGRTLVWYQPPDTEPTDKIESPRNRPGRPRRPGFPSAPSLACSEDGNTVAVLRGAEVLFWRADDRSKEFTVLDMGFSRSSRPGDDADRDRERFDPSWRAAALAPDGRSLYLLRSDETLHAFTLEGNVTRPLPWVPSIGVVALALSPDGESLALGLRDGQVEVLDTASGIVTRRWDTNDDDGNRISNLAFAPDHRLAVATRQGPIELWDVPSSPGGMPSLLVHLTGHHGAVTTLAFDHEGRRLASGGEDRSIVIWDLDIVRDELKKIGLGW